MAELFAHVFISVDGSAFGTRSPGYFGYYGPDLERWVTSSCTSNERLCSTTRSCWSNTALVASLPTPPDDPRVTLYRDAPSPLAANGVDDGKKGSLAMSRTISPTRGRCTTLNFQHRGTNPGLRSPDE